MLDQPRGNVSRDAARARARQARYARRQRAGLGVYSVELSAAVLDALVALGWLKERDSADRVLVGQAIAAALTELAEGIAKKR
jgi:hypothetical protein